MATRERPAERGRRRLRSALRQIGSEHRLARITAGLSLRDSAAASSTSRSRLWRFERGETDRLSLSEIGAWFAVVGLDLVLKTYPAGDPIRDVAHVRLLERLRSQLHPSLQWRTEVPFPIQGDLRAWDAVIANRGWRVAVEAETVIADVQALERRLALKRRDGAIGHLILLVADTPRNRRAIAAAPAAFPGLTLRARHILPALREGRDPGGSGIVIM